MPTNASLKAFTRPTRAVVVTALSLEYKAVRALMISPSECVTRQGTVYEVGRLLEADAPCEVCLVEVGQGNTSAALEVERAIRFYSPQAVFFVGIAGGIKDVQLGDVVAADKIYGYEAGKESRTGFLPRPTAGTASYRLIQRARAEAKKAEWHKLRPDGGSDNFRVFVGALAAGEKVVANTSSKTAKFLRTQYSDALAVEMEGRGFLEAAHANPGVEALVIRGISDLLSGKVQADASGSQERAAANAAVFLAAVLRTLITRDSHEPVDVVEFSRPINSYHFDVRHYAVELDIRDKEGSEVRYKKVAVGSAEAAGIRSYVDHLGADGSIDDVWSSPGKVQYVIVDKKRVLILTKSDTELPQGEVFSRSFGCTFRDCFVDPENSWTCTPPSPRKYIEVRVIFPEERGCFECWGEEARDLSADRPTRTKEQPRVLTESGKCVIEWRVSDPILSNHYRLTWRW